MTKEFEEKVYKYCLHCDEEYEVPEDEKTCPICGKTALQEI